MMARSTIAPRQRPDTLMQLSRSSILEVRLVPAFRLRNALQRNPLCVGREMTGGLADEGPALQLCGGLPRRGQYRHGEWTKAAIAEQRKFSALLKMLRSGLT